jgi:hypothetical protein
MVDTLMVDILMVDILMVDILMVDILMVEKEMNRRMVEAQHCQGAAPTPRTRPAPA